MIKFKQIRHELIIFSIISLFFLLATSCFYNFLDANALGVPSSSISIIIVGIVFFTLTTAGLLTTIGLWWLLPSSQNQIEKIYDQSKLIYIIMGIISLASLFAGSGFMNFYSSGNAATDGIAAGFGFVYLSVVVLMIYYVIAFYYRSKKQSAFSYSAKPVIDNSASPTSNQQ